MSKFFASTKRSEIGELKDELHSKDKGVVKDAVKKVIACMTVGKDVSNLFPDVVQCMQTSSVEMKKLVYLYLMNYAASQPELAILAVNTFRKDAEDPNPLIRALTVRTMGCIKLEEVIEYLLEPLRKCCVDHDPYVRKTSAICICKVYQLNPEVCEDQGLLEILNDLTQDSNPMVVANAVSSLAHIQESTGRRDLLELDNFEVQARLLAALNECNEWGQVVILDSLSSWLSPQSVRDPRILIDRVFPRVKHSNPAVVLSSVKLIARLIPYLPEEESIVKTTMKRLVAPLVSLLACNGEEQYVCLRSINILCQQFPDLLVEEIRMFFCKYSDPIYVKLEKLEILIMLTTDENVEQVLVELGDYATEIDMEFSKRSIRGIGKIALKLDFSAGKCIDVLLALVDKKINYIVQEAVVVIRDIFRKFPSEYARVLGPLCDSLESLDQPEAKTSMIWIIGEYAEKIENCQDILSPFIQVFQFESLPIQQQILTASVKFFLKCPKQGQSLVTRVLQLCTEESDNVDLRDRAFFYWRLLSTDPELTKKIVLCDKPQLRFELTLLDPQVLEKLISQIGFLSSVFHQIPERFISSYNLGMKAEDVLGRSGGVYDDDENGEERQAKLTRLKNQTRLAEQGALDFDHQILEEKKFPGSNGLEDLNDIFNVSSGTTASPAPPTVQAKSFDFDSLFSLEQPNMRESEVRAKYLEIVLSRTQPGSKKTVGVEISACLEKPGNTNSLTLNLSVGNFTSSVLTGFAIQFNKNAFSLAPEGPIEIRDILPNSTCEASIPVKIDSSLALPLAPSLELQAALKCSVDVFYFSVPMHLHAIIYDPTNYSIDRNSYILKSSAAVARISRSIPENKIFLLPDLLKLNFREIERGKFYFAKVINDTEIFLEISRSGLILCGHSNDLLNLIADKILF